MQQRLYLLSIIFCLFISSCHDDNEPENISWSRDASALIKKGISLTYEKGEVIMNKRKYFKGNMIRNQFLAKKFGSYG